MNLLLVEQHELAAGAKVRLTGRRARHLLAVLGVAVGRTIEAGIVDGPVGTAEVTAVTSDSVTVRLACDRPTAPTRDVLFLAVPRPKVLARMLEHSAALGFATIVLLRTWRVDKSHLDSRLMTPGRQRAHLLLGLEQARRTLVPRVLSFARFRPFVEDHLPTLPLPPDRFCAHPPATVRTGQLRLVRNAAFALAMGPERGFVDYEVEQLAAHGFAPVSLGPHPLRTESALSALFGQLDLLRSKR